MSLLRQFARLSRSPRSSVAAILGLVALAVVAGAVAGTKASAKNQLVVLTSVIGKTIGTDAGSTTNTPEADVYDTLLTAPATTDKDGLHTFSFKKVIGELAASYKRNANTGTYTFTLRKNVKSCAGNTLTSADVVYSVARAKASPVSTGSASTYNTGGVFADSALSKTATDAQKALDGEVRAVNANKVQIVAKVKDNGLLPLLVTQYPTSIYDSKEAKAHATASDPWSVQWLATHAAGFGPYCLSNWSTDQQTFTVTPNKGFFYVPKLTVLVRGVPQSSNRLAALQSGDADVVDGLSPDEYAQVNSTKSLKHLVDFGSTLNLAIIVNHNQAPWSGPNGILVRQAVSAALDRSDIVKNAMGGRGRPFLGVIPSTIPNSFSYPGLFKYDQAKAKSLLARAGYPNGNGLPSSGLQLSYPSESSATIQPIAIAIKSALAKIGMNIDLNPIPSSEFNTRQFGRKDLSMSLQTGGVGLYNALIYIKTWYVSSSAGGLIGPGNFINGDVDRIWQAGANSSDPKVQREDAKQVQDILVKALPVIPVARLPLDAAIRSNVTGVNISGPGLLYLGHVTKK